MKRKRQKGMASVEFAVVGAVFLLLLLAALEMGRALFVWNTLNEATRRGARLAAVCPVNAPAIANVAVFNAPGQGGDSAVLDGLDTSHVKVDYLDPAGAPLANPAASPGTVAFVRVGITGYSLRVFIPFLDLFGAGTGTPLLRAPAFATTLPAESLGLVPDPANPAAGTTRCF
jgi:Flp pilus assembly protein TadG